MALASTGRVFNNVTAHHKVHSLFANTTRSSSSSTSYSSSFTLSSSARTSLTTTTTTAAPVTIYAGNGGSGGAGTGSAADVPASTSTPASLAPTPGPPTTTVVASVVGSVAGVAVVLLVVLVFLRWKRRHGSGLRLLSDGDAGSRFRGVGPSPAGGDGGGGAMADRGLPFNGAPAALAALPSNKRISRGPSAGFAEGERTFYRVSGKKLPSVLQHGGDGYSDPRQSTISGMSISRDSQGWWEGPETQRFAVGSPMRPESGIVVVKPGPARTPVQTPLTEHAPVSEYNFAPPSPIDPIGRSQVSQDVSRGSGSRFTENI